MALTLASCSGNSLEPSDSSTETNSSNDTKAAETPKAPPAKKDASPSEPVPSQLLSQKELEQGWIQLFDGQSLFGWNSNNKEVTWAVKEGVITADSDKAGLLVTTVPFADFELKCDFRMAKGANSGIFLRSVFKPTDPTKDCYELNICNTNTKFPTGSFVGRKVVDNVNGEGEWMTYHIRCEGPTIYVRLNGEEVVEFTDDGRKAPVLTSGHIGLQKNEGKIEFKNVLLRPINTTSLFNGDDLAGWKTVPGGKSEFSVVDGAIHASNGPGFLETESTHDDFILQFDAKINGEGLNSGVFFRAIQGTEEAPSNGYEFQVQNGFKDGDRSQPEDSGSGAIFRRVKARWVIANDNEWFAGTLIAHDLHFASWINGIQVIDWTDDREPNENPRRGARTKAGHFSLQGHDPTTDLDFRNLRIADFKIAPAQ